MLLKIPSLLLLPALTAVLHAGVPQKLPLSNYSRLWTNSPFTSKPPTFGSGPIANPLDDYALLGVSPIGKGHRVTLINKKQPDQRITVETGKTSADGFSIIKVNRKAGQPLETTVEMASGSMQGTVSFDEKLLTIAAPPPVAPAAPAQAPQPIQGQAADPNQAIQRQPRPRVVPPPASSSPNINPAAGQIPGQRPSNINGRRR